MIDSAEVRKQIETVIEEMGARPIAKISSEYGEWDLGNDIAQLLQAGETEEAINKIIESLQNGDIDEEGFVFEMEALLMEVEEN